MPCIPTTDLYFRNVVAPRISRSPFGRTSQRRPVRRIGENSFIAGRHAVVVRRDAPAVIARILRHPDLALTYVIDDDLSAAETDGGLPDDYRRRLIALRDGQHRTLVDRADHIVVCSDHLAEVYGRTGKPVSRLDPHWALPFADDRHFVRHQPDAPLDVAYMGSVTHGADRAFVFEVMTKLLERRSDIRFTLVSSRPLGNALDGHPAVRRLRPLPWWLYLYRARRARYHLALYPMLDTPFNRGRSLNKLIEHAVAGAPGIYSRRWDFAGHVREGETGHLAENIVSHWVDAADEALGDLPALQRMHGEAAKVAKDLNNPERQTAFWSGHLGLSPW